jgi:hypothetical protein
MATSLAQLGIRINRNKLLAQVVELAESRLYWQHRADDTLPSYNSKETRAKLSQTLADVNDSELLVLAEQLLTLNEIGLRASQTYERIQSLKSEPIAA